MKLHGRDTLFFGNSNLASQLTPVTTPRRNSDWLTSPLALGGVKNHVILQNLPTNAFLPALLILLLNYQKNSSFLE